MEPISRALNEHELFLEQLRKEFPAEDEKSLADTLEGETNLTEVIAGTLRSATVDAALARGLKKRIDEMRVRLERFEASEDRKRTLCLDAMERANIKKIAEPDFTASLRSTPQKVVVVDEAKIPPHFFEPQPSKLSKRELLQALKDGMITEGATLSNPARTISIRTK